MLVSYKKKLIIILFLVVALTIIQYVLPGHSKLVAWYDAYIFRPFQSLRNSIFSFIPFSVGDFLYLFGGILLTVVIVKWIYFLIRFKKHKHEFAHSFIHTLIVAGVLYIFFILGWGGNYYKSSLSKHWKLQNEWKNDSALLVFDNFLIDKMNEYAGDYKNLSFKEIDDKAKIFYKKYTDNRTHGVNVKSSVFGHFLQYLRIQGYYNPFTGEAQVNDQLPSFMLPFVICHEMAHQTGIAAEDDANLLSYAVSTASEDNAFRYSAYFNIWLYTHSKLRALDSVKANELKLKINPLTLAHIDTLRDLRKKFKGPISNYTGAFYDGYLRLHHQEDGIGSYNKVTLSAWALEEKRKLNKDMKVTIP